jgi:hypothetical protein
MFSLRWFLRRLLPPRLPKPRKKYIGLVHGYSVIVDDEKATQDRRDKYWILTEFVGKRSIQEVGRDSHSPFFFQREAMVKAWAAGGPLPPLGYVADDTPPKPRKSKPQPTKHSNIIVLPKRAA